MKKIHSALDELRSLFILANQDRLEAEKERLLPQGSIKKAIYSLCDGTNTASEIAEAIGKDNPYVNSYLSILRREGLIRKTEKNGKIAHEQIF